MSCRRRHRRRIVGKVALQLAYRMLEITPPERNVAQSEISPCLALLVAQFLIDRHALLVMRGQPDLIAVLQGNRTQRVE